MKRLTKYCLIILILSLFACGEQSPTELIYDGDALSDDVEIEVISTNPEEIVYTTGYDSTGIVEAVPQHLSNIYVSGIKNSSSEGNIFINYYSAIFFDSTQEIRNPHDKRVGYRTRIMGKVFFDNVEADVVTHIIHVREADRIRDEFAGMKYEHRRRALQNQFPFDSNILFSLKGMQMRDRNIEFEIPTPKEISGKIVKSGSAANSDLRLMLSWNKGSRGDEIEIVIGGIVQNGRDPFPLLRFRTKDDGELTLPASVIRPIPFKDYNEIVFSFIRRKLKNDSSLSGLDDPFVVAQSIHNIKVVIQ